MKTQVIFAVETAISNLKAAQRKHGDEGDPKDTVQGWLRDRAQALEKAHWGDMELEAALCEWLAEWFETPEVTPDRLYTGKDSNQKSEDVLFEDGQQEILREIFELAVNYIYNDTDITTADVQAVRDIVLNHFNIPNLTPAEKVLLDRQGFVPEP